jgi:CHAD domain-containing protein
VSEPARNVEREVKLGAWPGFVLPSLDGLADWVAVAEPGHHLLDATYHDADDLRLIRSGITLRHRLGEGGDSGRWTLKLPGTSGGGVVLDRTEISVDASAETIPAELADAVAGVLRGAPLRPVARLQTERKVVVLRDGGGRTLGEVADDEVTVLDGERVAARFRELEVESAAGAPDDFHGLVVGRLREAGAGEPDLTPKLVRALGPRALTAPDPTPLPLGRNPTMASVVQQAMASAVQRLLAHDPIARLDLGTVGVHQARVSTRRLRSDLRTFEVVLDADWAESLREELMWVADTLGAVRDVDVLGIRFRRDLKQFDRADAVQGERLLRHLAAQRRERFGRLRRTMSSERYLTLLDRLVDSARQPKLVADAERPAADVLSEIVAQPWHKLRKAVRALSPEPTNDELHALRIKAKRARYASEAAARAVPEATEFAAKVAELQDVLGQQHDAVVAESWLRDTVTLGVSRRQAMVAGLLIAAQREEAAARRDEWREVWRQLDHRKLRAWMGRHG